MREAEVPSLGHQNLEIEEKTLQRVAPTHLCVLFLRRIFSSVVRLGLSQAAPYTYLLFPI